MTSIEKFNDLNGRNIKRTYLEDILQQAKTENETAVIYRISKILNENPDVQRFNINIVQYPAPQGLAGAMHTGDYREALDDCGRLRKGWKFVKGNVVKVEKKDKFRDKIKKISFKDLDLSEFEPYEKNELLREALGLGKEYQGKVYLEKYIADFYSYGRRSKKYTNNLKQGISIGSVEDRCQKIDLDGRILYISKKKTLDYFTEKKAEHRRKVVKEVRKKEREKQETKTEKNECKTCGKKYKFLIYKTQTSNKYTLAFSFDDLASENKSVFDFRKTHKGQGYNEFFVINNVTLLEKYKKGTDYLILSKEDYEKKDFYKHLEKQEVENTESQEQIFIKYVLPLYEKRKANPDKYRIKNKTEDILQLKMRTFGESLKGSKTIT